MAKEKKPEPKQAKVEVVKEEPKVLCGIYSSAYIKADKMKELKKQLKDVGHGYTGYNVTVDKEGNVTCKEDKDFCFLLHEKTKTVTVLKSPNVVKAIKQSADLGTPAINGQDACYLPPEEYILSLHTSH